MTESPQTFDRTAAPTRWQAILRGLCPRCRRGKIFRRSMWLGLPPMYERCAVCDLKFEREQGYFLGAMYISYMLAVPVMALFAILVWRFTHLRIERVVIVAAIALLPFAPFLTVIARVVWLHFDRAMDPD